MYYQQHLVNIFQWGWTMWLENVIKCWLFTRKSHIMEQSLIRVTGI